MPIAATWPPGSGPAPTGGTSRTLLLPSTGPPADPLPHAFFLREGDGVQSTERYAAGVCPGE